MSASKITATLPLLAHPDVFRDPARTIMTAEGKALLTYDPVTRSGFIYEIESRTWFIQAPVDFLQFALVARLSGHTVADTDDARVWLQACRSDFATHGSSLVPAGTKH